MAHHELFTADRRRNAWVLRVHAGRIVDDPQTDDLRRDLACFIKDAEPANLVVDLSSVQMVSSAGLAFFQHLSRAVTARNGYAAFCGLNPDVRGLFRMVGFDTIFTMFDDAQAAVAAFD